MKRRTISVLLALVLALSLCLMTALPVSAGAILSITVTPDSATAGATTDYSIGFTPATVEATDVAINFDAFGTTATDMVLSAVSTTIGDYSFTGFSVDPTGVTVNDSTKIITFTGGTVAVAATTISNTSPGTGLVITNDQDAGTQNVTISTTTDSGTFALTIDPDAATQLAFTTEPAGSVSGIALTTQPIVEAQDQFGNTDTTYVTNVVAAEDDAGALSGTTTIAPVAGVATFTDLVYTATADAETFQINVTSGTLTGATSADVVSDVVATQLVFTTQPAAGANSGALLGTQPVVAAQDADNTVDTDFTETVTITTDVGALSGDVDIAAVGGVATFTDLVHTASADNQVTTLTADDEAGVGTDLPSVNANTFTTLVIATKLAFIVQPAGSVSGVALTTQPVVVARDAGDVLDEDYVTSVVAATDDAGTLTGTTTQTPVAGVATFTDLVYTATADSETFEIDVTSGTLTGATSSTVTSGVVATKLVIVTQPAGAVSGSALLIQPVIHAVNDAGVLDTDYVTACAVAKESGVGTVTGTTTIDPMVAGVATFTNVTVTESPVVHDSYTLEFTSGTLDAVVSDAFKVFDKVLDLNDDAWTLISTDDYVISSGDDTSVFEGAVSLKYKYTGSSFVSATIADLEPVEALYLKTTGDDGWVGLNYSTVASPGASIKALVTGWNLVSSATSTAADIVLSPLRYALIGQDEGTGLATLVSQGSYNINTGDWYIDATTWSDVIGTMNPFDGYWVYMNAAKTFGVIPQ